MQPRLVTYLDMMHDNGDVIHDQSCRANGRRAADFQGRASFVRLLALVKEVPRLIVKFQALHAS